MKKNLLLSLIALAIVLVIIVTSCISCIIVGPEMSSTTTKPTIESPDESGESYDYRDTFYLVDALFRNYSIFDVDYESAVIAAIRAYLQVTGDKYAMFYTPAEYEELISDNQGDLYGIGVQVIFDYDGYFMEVVMIMPDSPAQSTLEVGDKLTHIKVDGKTVALADIVEKNKTTLRELYPDYTDDEINNAACYETFQYAVSKLKGAEGTYAEFTVDRNGTVIDIKAQRAKVTSVSVTCKTSKRDPSVGIISISEFNLTTPTQFKSCMDQLIASGCDKFIFDLRNNPGGDLASVVAVLSTLLQRDDIILSTKDSSGAVEITKVDTVKYASSSAYSTCNVTNEDIGKYRGYDMVVLANGNSASAAELFTSALRDHELATIVGEKTYGKGSMQSIISLSAYGEQYHGALKLTTKLYFPPCGVGYDGGIGIEPDHTVALEGEAANINFYKLTEDIDNQLQEAVSVLID